MKLPTLLLLVASVICVRITMARVLGGVNLIAEGFEGPYPYGSQQVMAGIQAARSDNVSWVCLSFVAQYTASINSTGPFYPVPGGTPSGAAFNNASTPTLAGVKATVEYAQSLGLKVILRPMIDPDWRLTCNQDGTYRGNIGLYFNSSQWDDWFLSYRAMLTPWLTLAQELAIDGFCMGAELTATEGRVASWVEIAELVRSTYKVPGGIVYYSSVLEGNSLFPWNVSDFVAIDVYPRLELANPDPTAATVEQLVAAWQPTLSLLDSLSHKYNRPVLLAETGICSVNKTGIYLTPAYFACYQFPVNEGVQAKYYEALFMTAWTQPWFAGVFFWKWALQGGPTDTTFFPYNKTAAQVMAHYYGGAL
jgi:hypothetical protein